MNSLEFLKIYNRTISSRTEDVGSVVKEIIQYLHKNYGNIHTDVIFDLRVIINELLVNAVVHGNKQNSEKFVNITTGITTDKYVLLTVNDDGDGYDYLSYLKKNEEKREEYCWGEIEECGRGIKIIISLCDRVEFNKRGNRISILKKLEK